VTLSLRSRIAVEVDALIGSNLLLELIEPFLRLLVTSNIEELAEVVFLVFIEVIDHASDHGLLDWVGGLTPVGDPVALVLYPAEGAVGVESTLLQS